ncbi:hypothetical protein [Rhodococcus daqingensis]|uniref:Uncharacterized protein n=1 Tax=Rhodococcus daqingensis TaxID=2479363 RepID=A0ABW2S3B1_9NOCA
MKSTRCTTCGERIFFAATPNDESVPIDAVPAADGNLSVTFSDPPRAVLVLRAKADAMRAAGIQLYRPHFASCPQADHHRRSPRTTSRRR